MNPYQLMGPTKAAGDINGDGYADLITSDPSSLDFVGHVSIFYGGPDVDTARDIIIRNVDLDGWQIEFGKDCAGIGDFNGDGVDDFAFSFEASSSYFWVYIYSGVAEPTGVTIEHEPTLPERFRLYQNYPNPFNPSTTIPFDLPRAGHVRLTVYNIAGQQVATLVDRELQVGHYAVTWDGKDAGGRLVASGVYVYRLEADGITQTRKMIMVK